MGLKVYHDGFKTTKSLEWQSGRVLIHEKCMFKFLLHLKYVVNCIFV